MRKAIRTLTLALIVSVFGASLPLQAAPARDRDDRDRPQAVKVIKRIVKRVITILEDLPLPPKP